ncbi:MAG: bis(5'-nucleosyl)-tetraphosphatase (symmetrical) YqeK [Firmicutes bacterium]|nr:bis(5'-nucleosyl)-tetraphosphatase (symmetrical) YqeK [Bacillota bacterium]
MREDIITEDAAIREQELLRQFQADDEVYLTQFAAEYQLVAGKLGAPRLLHSLGVAQTAARLAQKYGADDKKAYLAGLCHDIAKELPRDEQLTLLLRSPLAGDEDVLAHKVLWHAPAGAVLLGDFAAEYPRLDEEIQQSCLWHTLGKPQMTVLEQLVFVADLIEPGRDFPDLAHIRAAAEESLTAGVAACMYGAIHFLEVQQRFIHPLAFQGYEYYKNLL